MPESLASIRFVEIVDLLFVWALAWAGISWLRTTPARVGLAGLGILLAFYLVARQVGLTLTTWILQGFAAVAVLIGVVVFQRELRRLFEQIATLWIDRTATAGPGTADLLARSIAELVARRWGGLIVLSGRTPLEGHLAGGIALDAHLSEPLLLSIFDPHSPGHDGAVIVVRDRITRFATHLPLSASRAQLGTRGTRHAAGLGLAERTDALAIIVSEERGTVSVAEGGSLRTLEAPGAVATVAEEFLSRLAPRRRKRAPSVARLLDEWREGAAALLIAVFLWFLAVPGGTSIEVERHVRVAINGVPSNYLLERIEPEMVRVRIAGRRRDLFLMSDEQLEVHVDAVLVDLGRRTFSISTRDVRHPERVEVRSIEPDQVKIELREKPVLRQDNAAGTADPTRPVPSADR